MTSVRQDQQEGQVMVLDIVMPIRVFWQVKDVLRRIDYHYASQEHPLVIQETLRQIFRLIAPYAIFEKDRVWLHEQVAKV